MEKNSIKRISRLIDWGISVWDSIMKATLLLPFAKIDKNTYLNTVLKRHLSPEDVKRALETAPTKVMGVKNISKLAQKEARKNVWYATLLSFITAIPTNWLMWPAIIIDLLQFQIHVFLISQKLLFLYGKYDIEKESQVNEKANRLMLIVSTIMIGKQKLSRVAKSAAGMVGKQIVERYGTRLLSKFIIFNTLRQIAKWMGISLTKTMLIEGINMLIPIICAAISALVSYALISPMAKKLQSHLKQELEKELNAKEENAEI
ncbi:MAG: hypothetical protein IK005_09370 [Paludibacteraceae bacterium]|nr:hypothetical protein [Paludibacteraceae bacterium]MBR4840672.1 hypothetical protein [Paludibacteraceae bacterium]